MNLPVGLEWTKAWLGSPTLALLSESAAHWHTLRAVLAGSRVAGARVNDARVAALRAKGIDPFKNKFTPGETCKHARDNYAESREVAVAGRISSGCWFVAAWGTAIFQITLLAQTWRLDQHALPAACVASPCWTAPTP